MQDPKVMLDKELTPPYQNQVAQKLDVMMKMLTDLSSRVKMTEYQQIEVGASTTVSPPTSCPVRSNTRRHMSPDQEPDLSEKVCCRLANTKQLPVFTKAMAEDTSTSEDEE